MRILKQAVEGDFLSDADKFAILGEMFNIMCNARVFDIDGKYTGPIKTNGKHPLDAEHIDPGSYLNIAFDGYTFDVTPVMGYVILPAGSKDFVANTKKNLEEFVLQNFAKYEKEYVEKARMNQYLSKYVSVWGDVLSTLYAKPNTKQIKDSKTIAERNDKNNRNHNGQRDRRAEGKTGVKIQFAHTVDYMLERYARFTWYFISIDEFEFEITATNKEHRLSERICSVFYDAMDITKFSHGYRTMELQLSDLKFSENMLSERLEISSYQNPIARELKVKSANVHGRPKFVDLDRDVKEGIIDEFALTNVDESGKFICSICDEQVYDDNYIAITVVHDGNGRIPGNVICPFCMHTGRDDIRKTPKSIYRVKFPMTTEEKIDSISTHSARKKDILKCAINGCIPVTIVENGISIKHVNLSGRYIVVSSKINSIKFTKFAANIGQGVKMLSTYESDKTLD